MSKKKIVSYKKECTLRGLLIWPYWRTTIISFWQQRRDFFQNPFKETCEFLFVSANLNYKNLEFRWKIRTTAESFAKMIPHYLKLNRKIAILILITKCGRLSVFSWQFFGIFWNSYQSFILISVLKCQSVFNSFLMDGPII